jgi:hypothetical protein
MLELLISLDQFAHVLLGGPKYVTRGGPCPSADETISSKVGRQAIKGRNWARAAELVINTLFRALGDRDHCRRSIEWDELR